MLKNKLLWEIIIFSLVIFSPGLVNFFASDDWYHLDVSRINNAKEFLNFFSLSHTPQSTPFYRPISTQLFFFIFQNLFGLNSLPFHLFIFALFAFNLYLINKLALIVFKNKYQSLITVFIYAFSATNFVRLYFISVVQEVMMLNFLLLAFLSYLKISKFSKFLAFIFFILAILSKETAVVFPLILITFDLIKKRFNISRLIPYFLIIIPYLFIRYFGLGEGVVSSYVFDFSVRKILNTFSWYFLWSLGVPELLVDYTSRGFRILPRFYTDFPYWSKIILPFILLAIISFFILLAKNIKSLSRNTILALAIFIIGLLPVIFLPMHKFTLQLTLPMVGFSLMIGSLFKSKISLGAFLGAFVILNLLTNLLTYQTHYSVSRGKISQRVFEYFKSHYPKVDGSAYFEFINDTPDFGKEWGGSKQIAQATSNSDLFKVLYKNHNLKVYFEDDKGDKRPEAKKIVISTRRLLQY